MSLARSAGLAGGVLTILLSVSQAADVPRWVKVDISKDSARAALKEAAPSPEVQAKDDEGEEYVLIRADDEAIRGLLERGVQVTNATQADFVYRLYEVYWKTNEQRDSLLASGLDLIEFDRGQRQALIRATNGDIRRLGEEGLETKPREDLDQQFNRARNALLAAADAGAYHTYEEVRAELNAMAKKFPDQARVHELGLTVQGRKLLAIEIGNRAGGAAKRPQVLVMGCHHAREWISVEIPMKLARELLENPAGSAEVRALVKTARIWIIPMLNPDGHHYSVTTDRLWRKNLRNNGDGTLGVDLNRNYDGPDWGKSPGSSGNTSSEIYRGPQPFSEPETRIIRDLVTGRRRLGQLRGVMSYHSFSQLILYPWGYTNETAPDIDPVRKQAEAYRDRIIKAGGVPYTAEQASDLYITNGDTTDYVWKVTNHKVPPLTVELRPKSISQGGFVLPESQIEPTWKENKPAILGLLKGWAGIADGTGESEEAGAKEQPAAKP
jgi:carboxypeptidase T